MAMVVTMGDTENNESFITEKKGPLPVWGWAALAVGVFIIFRGLPHLSSAATGTISTVGNSAGSGAGSSNSVGGSTPTTTNTTNPLLTWLANANNAATSLGVNPSDFQTAVTDYLANSAIPSTAETALNAVLHVVGNAPGIDTPIYSAPTPTSTAPVYKPFDILPNLLGDIQHQLAANMANHTVGAGESYFADVISTGQGVIGLTNDGGIYEAGNNFNGTPLQMFGNLLTVGAAGPNAAAGGTLSYDPTNGSYSINLPNGKKYTFGPGATVGA